MSYPSPSPSPTQTMPGPNFIITHVLLFRSYWYQNAIFISLPFFPSLFFQNWNVSLSPSFLFLVLAWFPFPSVAPLPTSHISHSEAEPASKQTGRPCKLVSGSLWSVWRSWVTQPSKHPVSPSLPWTPVTTSNTLSDLLVNGPQIVIESGKRKMVCTQNRPHPCSQSFLFPLPAKILTWLLLMRGI